MAGQVWLQSKLLPSVWQLVQIHARDWNSCLIWFQVLLLLCSDMVQAQILEPTTSVPSSLTFTPVQQLPNATSAATLVLNRTSSIMSTPSHLYSSMSSYVILTSQQMMLVSTPGASLFPSPSSGSSSSSMLSSSSASSSSISMTTQQTMMPTLEIPGSILYTPTIMMFSPSESLFPMSSHYTMQTSYGETIFMPSASPTTSVGYVFPSSSETLDSAIPDMASTQMMLKSTLVTLLPTPSATKFLMSSSLSSSSSAGVTTATPPLSSDILSVPTAIYPSVLSSSPSPSIIPTRTSSTTTVPDLSSLPSSSRVVILKPTPTVGPSSRPPTTEKSKGGPLTMAEWIGVALAATFVALIILCVIIWWLLKAGRTNNKRKPTYSIHNVTIDYSRSTSNDPKDIWRNSLLLESMSTRIVVPEENDDDLMQTNYAATNQAYEGISDEEQPPSASKDTLTRV
ncbi:uncharacterized protein [Amphiura filiformis]|uniref:uncharacterized protein n=1 Tax=Amphiura filiformis TaxID=82378 RepID=UPI003B22173A